MAAPPALMSLPASWARRASEKPCALSRRSGPGVRDGDRVSVYPFMAVVANPRPLRPSYPRGRFVLDQHLGRLAAYLRLLGLDCVYRALFPDEDLARVSVDENRILLSRDKRLLMLGGLVATAIVVPMPLIVTGANDVYVVTTGDGRELLLPAIRDVILSIDIKENVMTVHLIPGLIEQEE